MPRQTGLGANPLANLPGLDGRSAPPPAAGIGPFVTAAMLAAASSTCECETCRLMAKASVLMRKGLLEEAADG